MRRVVAKSQSYIQFEPEVIHDEDDPVASQPSANDLDRSTIGAFEPDIIEVDADDNERLLGQEQKTITTEQPSSSDPSRCCDCTGCDCPCHLLLVSSACPDPSAAPTISTKSSENFVRYLFDYDLFSVTDNMSHCGYLLLYLKHEGILSHCCVISTESNRAVGPFAFPSVSSSSTGSAIRTETYRDEYGTLRFKRPANVIEPISDTPDIRKLMKNYIIVGDGRDWVNLRYALQLPAFMIYVQQQGSTNDLSSCDLRVTFDLRSMRLIGSSKTIGHRLAQTIAGIRHKYFGVPVPDFSAIEREYQAFLLQRRTSSVSQQKRKRNVPPAVTANSDSVPSSMLMIT
nr:MAG: hypothetical protein [Apis mellifra filamentous-like virus]